MRRNPAHVLLLCAVVVLCLAPAPLIQGRPDLPEGISAPEWLSASSGAVCEGECDGNEVLIGCGGSSASACCASLACTHFNGVCSGDAEILCQY